LLPGTARVVRLGRSARAVTPPELTDVPAALPADLPAGRYGWPRTSRSTGSACAAGGSVHRERNSRAASGCPE
jgi:hypothetical protein